MQYWLLVTHSAAIFPIMTYMWSWKRRKDTASIYMLIKFIFCVIFSLCYHTYHVNDVKLDIGYYDNWWLLDGYASTSLIYTATLYGLRVREPQFYITSYTIETGFLMLYMFNNTWFIITWLLLVTCSIIFIIKWRTLMRYIVKFYFLIFFTLVSGIVAAIMFCTAIETEDDLIYIKYHSLWHCFIFTTAGLSSILRYKLDEELYPLNRREQLDSI